MDPAGAREAVRRNELSVDHAKSAGIGDVERRVEKIGVVEDVKAVERELSFYRLCDGGGFAEAKIEIPEAEALQRIVAAIVGIGSEQGGPELGDRSGGIAEIVEAGPGARG